MRLRPTVRELVRASEMCLLALALACGAGCATPATGGESGTGGATGSGGDGTASGGANGSGARGLGR